MLKYAFLKNLKQRVPHFDKIRVHLIGQRTHLTGKADLTL